MDDGKRSNKTVWIVIGLVAALLFGCTMGALVGGLAGYGIGRRAAASGGYGIMPGRVTPDSGGATGRLPYAGIGAIMITQVVKASPAEKAGLLEGDIITALEGQSLTPDDTFANRLLRYKPGDTVRVSVMRAGRQQEIKVVLGTIPNQNTRAWLGIYYQQLPAMPRMQVPYSH